MKTKTNISGIVKMSLIPLAILFISALSPAQAVMDNDFETKAAIGRLDVLNSTMEGTLKYTASMVNEDAEAYESRIAQERLEDYNLNVQESISYQASMVNDDAEAYELAAAKERLENMILAIEESVRFNAPAAIDNEIVQNRIEYVDNRVYTIPVSDLAMSLVLTR